MNLSNTSKVLIFIGVIAVLIYLMNGHKTSHYRKCGKECDISNVESFESNEMPNTDNKLTNTYKVSNYAQGERGGEPTKDLDRLFDDSLAVDVSANDNFAPFDEAGCGEINACDEPAGIDKNDQLIIKDDLFNADNYLPQISHKDWFDVPDEPVNVKNRHLINVTRPIGIDSVASSKKNASYDIRGNAPCPKFVVSPWNQSSIDPDVNNKGFC